MSLKSLSGLKIGDYTLPTSDGTNGQVLQTDGSGNVTSKQYQQLISF